MTTFGFDFEINKSARARNISIRIGYDGRVVLTMPVSANEKKALDFLQKKQLWVQKHLSAIHIKPKPTKPQAKQLLQNGQKLPILGQILKLSIKETTSLRHSALIEAENLIVIKPRHSKSEETKDYITRFLKSKFRSHINDRVVLYNLVYNFKYNRIAIKDNKTNWGSCSTKGNLNFNWRLIFAPPSILDYVVVHELCHLGEHNHSDRFWNLVQKACPDFDKKRKWLRLHGKTLFNLF